MTLHSVGKALAQGSLLLLPYLDIRMGSFVDVLRIPATCMD
jgi:hypothetical protein